MPVSPALAESLASGVVEHYLEAEHLMLARIAKALDKGLDAPDWAEKKLLEVQWMRASMKRLIVDLDAKAAADTSVALAKAYNRGGASAVSDLAKLLGVSLEEVATPLRGLPLVELLVAETVGQLHATGPRILRSAIDGYQKVIADTTAQVLLGTQTRREASQVALNRFAQRGIVGFVDKSGRGWDLASYAEMAVRTGAGRASVQGHVDKLAEHGLDLVIISDAPQECDLCRIHEGKVYSASGRSPDHPSLDSARAAGLFHPGCRHSASLYQPGVTKPMGPTADPEGDKDRQKLRYLERQTRAAKRVEAAALDDQARKVAGAKVRGYQAKIRAHVDTTTAKRQPTRERIGRAR